jgi:hypothetical protein
MTTESITPPTPATATSSATPHDAGTPAAPLDAGVDFGALQDINVHDWSPVHPGTGETLPVVFEVYGEDTPQYRRALHAAQREQAKREKRNQQSFDGFSIDLAVGTIKNWRGNVRFNQEPLTFSVENARKLLANTRWLREQYLEFLNNRAARLGNG